MPLARDKTEASKHALQSISWTQPDHARHMQITRKRLVPCIRQPEGLGLPELPNSEPSTFRSRTVLF